MFSCKNFDSDLALQQIPNIFSIGKLKHWLLDRGIEHIDPQQAESIIENERSQIVVPDLKSGFKKPI